MMKLAVPLALATCTPPPLPVIVPPFIIKLPPFTITPGKLPPPVILPLPLQSQRVKLPLSTKELSLTMSAYVR